MALHSGASLGPYQIEAPLGEGGMGEVYRALDTRLDRTVAIKVLPEHFASDPDLKRRFEREAKAISSLNHPHICSLHDIGDHDGVSFLVMEHLEGETLAARLAREGPLATDDAARYATEIAGALDQAHQRGIVHRDLKPANVMLTASGAKVLDFGIAARLVEQDMETVTRSTTALTEAGGIAGTVPYMAPEVLRAETADARTDVWALGVVLYEMLAGGRPFTGKSGSEVTSAILRDPPPPLPARVPAGLQTIVRQCLEKDPRRRYQRAGEVRAAVQAAGAGAEVGPTRPGAKPARQLLLGLAGAAAVVVLVVAGWQLIGAPVGPEDVTPPADTSAALEEAAVPVTERPVDAEAYEAYLTAAYYQEQAGSGFARAVTEYERAVAIDPDYAAAHAGLSLAYALAPLWPEPILSPDGTPLTTDQIYRRARRASDRALELDDTLWQAHAAKGYLDLTLDWEWDAAGRSFDRAIALAPDEPWVHSQKANYLSWALGRYDEAIASVRRALELDPLSVNLQSQLAAHFYWARRFDEALAQADRVLERDPANGEAAVWRHWALAGLGRTEEALAFYGDPQSASPDAKLNMAYIYAAGGNAEEARRLIEEAEQEGGPSTSMSHAAAYAWVGRVDEAFEALDASYENREPMLGGIRITDNRWYPLHDDPRRAKMLERMNYPE